MNQPSVRVVNPYNTKKIRGERRDEIQRKMHGLKPQEKAKEQFYNDLWSENSLVWHNHHDVITV